MKTRKTDLKNRIHKLERAIAMNCLDCVCCHPLEVMACQITYCPLWQERPKKTIGLYTLVKQLKKKKMDFYEAEK